MNKQILLESREDCFIPRTADDAFKDASYGSPIEAPDGRKVGLVKRGNVTYLRNDWLARIVRAIKRIIK